MSLFSASGPLPERPKKSEDVTARALIKRREAGAIIGSAGSTIGEIRELFKVRTGVSKDEKQSPDRVLTVVGRPEDVSGALGRIIDVTAAEASEGATDPATSIHGFRLLVPHVSIGGILGKGGEVITKIQHESNTRISASREPLPGSTERLLEIYGTPASVSDAVFQIINLLAQDTRKDQVRLIRYIPGVSESRGSAFGSRGGHAGRNSSSIIRFGASNSLSSNSKRDSSSAGSARRERRDRTSAPEFDPVDPANTKITMSIPASSVGGIIGRHGNNINRIRRETGASITISEDNGARFAIIIGPKEKVVMAEQQLFAAIESAEAQKQAKEDM